jgi:RNA polymerase II-associated factor 1
MTFLSTLFSTGFVSPPSARPLLAPEDEELLPDDESVTPVKRDGIKRKERPTDKGVSWLVKTQYISPLSMESAKLVCFSCSSLLVICFTNC